MLTTDQLALYEKDMYKKARESYQEEPVIYPQVFKVINNVKGGGDKFTQILGADRLKQHTVENEDIDFHSPVQGWQALIKYYTFSDGVNFSKDAVEDNVANGEIGKTLKGYANTWGSAIRNEKEIYGANIFTYGGFTSGDAIYNNAWGAEADGSGDLVYDSKPLFNLTGNTRTTKGSGTYFNAISSGALNPTNFETLYNLVSDTNAYSEQDRRVANSPDTLLTKHGADSLMARRILGIGKLPGGQLNDKNIYSDLVSPIKWAYLTGTAWYIGKKNHDLLQWHERQKPVIEFFRNQTNRGYRASVDARWGVLIKPGAWRIWGRTAGDFSATK